jgi:hypothetical protein
MRSLHHFAIRVPLLFLLEAHRRRRAAAEMTLDELKKEDRVNVHIKPMCIFLFRDGNFSLPHRVAFFPLQSVVFQGRSYRSTQCQTLI